MYKTSNSDTASRSPHKIPNPEVGCVWNARTGQPDLPPAARRREPIADIRTKIDPRITENPNVKVQRVSFDDLIEQEAKRQGKCPKTEKIC